MKTRADIDELIARWLDDPDWELEESDGFEDHKDELLAVRHKHEAEWKARAQREHAEAIAALTGPALAILPVSAQRAAHGVACDPSTIHFVFTPGDGRDQLPWLTASVSVTEVKR